LKIFKKIILVVVLVLVVMQFIPLEKTNPKIDENIAFHADKKVMGILKRSCYDCHSNETKWSIYSDIAPLSFEVHRHVEIGRAVLNFSEYESMDKSKKIKKLKRVIQTINNGMMPLSSYVLFHDEAVMSKEERALLVKWFENELKKLSPDGYFLD
jgi:uncharacterized membrane protein